ncbi:uncharacterized protein LOC143019568 [Oratosquilla oratoria]|uniref:uncharacterized protein LOC143019568 n=1 Tax=Oratosquilla oratoria TaxID=337810 RepID=UPI003F75F88E
MGSCEETKHLLEASWTSKSSSTGSGEYEAISDAVAPVHSAKGAEGGGGGGEGGHDEEERRAKGLGVFLAAIFLVGEIAGAGVLALPRAVADLGWCGLPLLVFLCVIIGYSGTRLGMCWVLVEERWPQYRNKCRKPYPVIAYRALGKPGRAVAVVAMNMTLFGVTTVYLILCGQLTHSLLTPLLPNPISLCTWILIYGFVLLPCSWIGTPKDFWWMSFVSMFTTFLACLVVIVQIGVELPDLKEPSYDLPTLSSFFLGYATILFSFGGACTFPTIQNDMKDRSQFWKSVVLTFAMLMLMYLPLATIGYVAFGGGVHGNILLSVEGPSVTIVKILILLHLFITYIIVLNPVAQNVEDFCGIEHAFGWRRCLVRTSIVLVGIVVALGIPDFGRIMAVIGATSGCIMSFILPPICYMRLCDAPEARRKLSIPTRVALCTVVILGISGGVIATYMALSAIASQSSFSASCFSPGI